MRSYLILLLCSFYGVSVQASTEAHIETISDKALLVEVEQVTNELRQEENSTWAYSIIGWSTLGISLGVGALVLPAFALAPPLGIFCALMAPMLFSGGIVMSVVVFLKHERLKRKIRYRKLLLNEVDNRHLGQKGE